VSEEALDHERYSITSLLDIFITSCDPQSEVSVVLCKRTYKNQITLPKKVMEKFEGCEYFKVTEENGKIVLEPVKITPKSETSLEKIRRKITDLGLTEKDIENAVAWARKP
jgi:hypothetical protein